MPERHGQEAGADYRYGFQGQEMDDEIKGEGNSINYKYRMHDSRIGRFFAIDPLAPKYPKWTPYAFSGNQVIHTGELEGLEPGMDLDNAKEGVNYPAQQVGKNDQRVYNYTVDIKFDRKGNERSREWVQGKEITGPNAQSAAAMSDHVYEIGKSAKVGDKVEGWELMKPYQDEGFKAGLYRKEIGGVYFYTFATAGTETDWSDRYDDIRNDGAQGLGLDAEQFRESREDALRIAGYVGSLKKGNKLTFVGHSLGGALASMNALATNLPAKTFNAAGLSVQTLVRYGLYGKSTKKIDSYIVRGEILNFLLTPLGQGAIGNKHYITSDIPYYTYDEYMSKYSNGSNLEHWSVRYTDYIDSYRLDMHSMARVLEGINNR